MTSCTYNGDAQSALESFSFYFQIPILYSVDECKSSHAKTVVAVYQAEDRKGYIKAKLQSR